MNEIIVDELKKSKRKLDAARNKEQQLWEQHQDLIKLAATNGFSYAQIAQITNVSKGRIGQIMKVKNDV